MTSTGTAITTWHVIAVLAVLVQLLFAFVVGLATYSFKTAISSLKTALKEAIERLEKSIETLFERQKEQGDTLAELRGEHLSQMRSGGCVKPVRATDPPGFDPTSDRCNHGERIADGR